MNATTRAAAAVTALAAVIFISSTPAYARPDVATPATQPNTTHVEKATSQQAAETSPLTSKEQRVQARHKVRAQVAKLALAQRGDKYAAGAAGPDAFDCSGLVVYAWGKAGIELPHYSKAQYRHTTPVKTRHAVPGDLAFYFENGAHHVAVYIGEGKVVHASDYGVGVIVSPLKGTPWTNTHFTSMGRVTWKDPHAASSTPRNSAQARQYNRQGNHPEAAKQ